MSEQESADHYQVRVFCGLFSAANSETERKSRVREFSRVLREEHFSGRNKIIFSVVTRYFHMTYSLISPSDFVDVIRSSADATTELVFEYTQMLILYRFGDVEIIEGVKPDGKAAYITDAEFTYALKRLREQTQLDMFGACLADTMHILVNGKMQDRKLLRGYQDARDFYSQQMLSIDHVGGQELPHGDVRQEADEILKEYAAAKSGESTAYRVLTGIREIDELTGGGAPGEMWFISGYTAEGKTTECINISYNAMINGQNVFYATAETLRDQVRRRLVSVHSLHPKFSYPRGLSADSLKKGKLTEDEERILRLVVEDIATDKSYGAFDIEQVPKRCTVDYFASLLSKHEVDHHVHIAVWDEIRLAGSGKKRSSWREELNDIITDVKQVAVNHKHADGSTGILLLAPYQVGRTYWQEAVKTGFYTKACLAETSEAEKTADFIWSHLVIADTNDIKCQVLKYRDGSDRVPEFFLDWNRDACKISSKISMQADLMDDFEVEL